MRTKQENRILTNFERIYPVEVNFNNQLFILKNPSSKIYEKQYEKYIDMSRRIFENIESIK